MADILKNPVKRSDIDFGTAFLKLGNGWTARVALTDSAENPLSPDDWARCLENPESLSVNPQKTIKHDDKKPVVVKDVQIGDKHLSVHIKTRRIGPGFRNFCRALLPAKAMHNLKTSQKLCKNNIPTAWPLAALQQKKLGLTTRSIYLTEYAQNSSNLYEYLCTYMPRNRPLKFKFKKHLACQIAGIFAALHRASLWHRDAKASNFLITEKNSQDDCKLILVDMDGIKPYRFRQYYSRFQALAKLAATLSWHPCIHLTDYLRTFTIYCNLTRLELAQRRDVFTELTQQALAIRILSLVKNAVKERKKVKSTMPERILIIKPSALGDIVLVLPALSSLRASFPNAHITWLVRNEFAPLIENNKNLTNIIMFDRKLLGKWYYTPGAFAALVRFIRQLRKPEFDLVIDLQGLFRTALFAWLTKSKKRFGMKTAREFAHLFYTHLVPPPADSQHLVDYYAEVVAAAGAETITTDFNLVCPTNAEREIISLLAAQNIEPNRYAVLVPGSAHVEKCWPEKNFATLAEKLAEDFDLKSIAVGTSREKPIVHKINSTARVTVADFAGTTDIPKLIALLKNAAIVVSNDTGPGHIAAALGVPLVMIFGPTNPARIEPYRRPQTIAAVDRQNRGSQIRNNHPKYRIDAVSIELVLQKARNQLQRHSV
jgi:heptosyltransferase-1